MQPRWVWALFAVVAMSQMGQGQSPSANRAPAAAIEHNFGKIPLTFEANQGQTNPQVKFLSRGKGYTAFLTSGGMVLSLHPSTLGPESALQANRGTSRQPRSVQLKLVGAAKNPTAVGEDMQPGKVNYFVGNDPTRWKTNIATYGRVRYKNVYAGIDVLYYGNHQQLEYDFEIQAGADPRQIQFEVTGADRLELDAEGSLRLTLGTQQLRLQTPSVYQQSNNRRMAVNGSYVLIDSKHVAFSVASYDPNKPLVIDPVLIYSTYLGGSNDEEITGLALDSAGSVYVAGFTDSVDFPVTSLGSQASGNDHAFVAKLDPTGSHLVYADYIGGNSSDYGYALAVSARNEVYLAGGTSSSNFPVVNPYQATYTGSFNTFLTRISADGASLLYSTYLGGSGSDVPAGVAVDAMSDVYVVGTTTSTNFPVANAYQPTVSPNAGGNYGWYGFVTKFVPDGSSLAYSTFLGGSTNLGYGNCGGQPCWGSPETSIVGLALDNHGNTYLAGNTNTYNFPTTPGAYQSTNSTPNNSLVGFVTKLNSSGSPDYSTYFYESSGSFTDVAAIAVDGSGSAYITGAAASDGTFPVTSTSICDPSVNGVACDFAFVTKFDSTGSSLVYSTFLGPNNDAYPAAIRLDQSNDAYVLAVTTSASFSEVDGVEAYSGGYDLLLAEVDPNAASQLFATFLGGSGDELAASMALDARGNIYVAGSTSSTDLPTTQGAFQTLSGENSDGFVMKIGPGNAPAVSLNPYSLQYSAIPTGSTSQAQQVLLRNMGSAPLSVTTITASQGFAETDNCAPSVPAAGSCTLSVTFAPTLVGQQQGSISISDNAAGSPHTISLMGIGTGNAVLLTPATLTFVSTPLKTSAAAQTVTLMNQDAAGLPITNIQVSGDYAQTNNCPATLASGSSCTVSVTFTPTATGTRNGTLSITDGAAGSPQSVALSGSGVDFTLTSSVTTTTIKAGGSATYTLTLASVDGAFNNAIQLNCSGVPAHSACNVSPASATPGTGSTSLTVTVSTTASTAEAFVHSARSQSVLAFWLQVPGFGIVGLFVGGLKPRRKTMVLVALVLAIACLLLLSGCAGGTGIASQGNSGTPSGTYTISVTGSCGSLQHSLPLSLTVQ